MVQPQLQWIAPAPLWAELANSSEGLARTRFRQPTMLGFASDDFMDDFMGMLSSMPCQLGKWRAVWETWREPASLPPSIKALPGCTGSTPGANVGGSAPEGSTNASEQSDQAKGLKLYQPAHQRYYLITACLVCRLPGLPDRVLDVNRGEQVSFVMRRLKREAGPEPGETTFPTTSNLGKFAEYAFVATPQGYQWQRVGLTTDPQARMLIPPGEERLPLFGVTYTESDGRKRRLLAGLVPVGKRETYIGSAVAVENGVAEDDATEAGEAEAKKPMDPRLAFFISQVVQPWRSLAEQESNVNKRYPTEPYDDSPDLWADIERRLLDAGVDEEDIGDKIGDEIIPVHEDIREQTYNQIQIASWYILLDFAEFLQTHFLKSVWWDVMPDESAINLTDEEQALVALLKNTVSSSGLELAEALVEVEGFRKQLEGANLAFDDEIKGPNLLFPGETEETGGFARSLSPPPPTFLLTDIADLVIDTEAEPIEWVDTMEDAIAKALEHASQRPVTAPPLPLAAQQQDTEVGDPGWFIIRCVFERPYCVLPSARVVISEPSEPFQLASFFDPEAPARPIRISLPLDTSPAGLRKFAKNTAFVMSDILTCQIGQIRNLTLADLVLSVLPWPFHKDLPEPAAGDCRDRGVSDGMVCSLSIPIVTLCALILLIIIVTLFEQFFHWIQFLIVCFKIPGLKGKETT